MEFTLRYNMEWKEIILKAAFEWIFNAFSIGIYNKKIYDTSIIINSMSCITPITYISTTTHSIMGRGLKGTVWLILKADMKSYIPLETAAIVFLANLFPKQGFRSEYVTADFICMCLLGLKGAKTKNYKMKNSCPYRDSNSRPLILKSSAIQSDIQKII